MQAALYVLLYVLVFLYGIVIGSFLNVCILRIPAGESLIPGSHCMSCGSRLRWRDLIPVFSWLILKGRCRYCGAKISAQYPLVEAANGLLYLAVFMANGWNLQSILYCLMASALLAIGVIDARTYEIPSRLNVFLFALGVAACAIDFRGIAGHLIGMACVSVPLYVLYRVSHGRAIGGGDIKLMAAAGLILGWQEILLAFFIGCVLGSVIHVIRMRVSGAGSVLALGPYLAAGIFISALFGRDMIGWYLGLIGL